MNKEQAQQKIMETLARARPAGRSAAAATGHCATITQSRDVVVDQSTTVVINDAGPRPGERIDDDQLHALRAAVYSLAKVDAMLALARSRGQGDHDALLMAARHRRWRELRQAFKLRSYRHLTRADYGAALSWLADRKRAALDAVKSKPLGLNRYR